MRKGKTSTGFAFSFDESRADDMRFVELLGAIQDENASGLDTMIASAKALEMLLGKEQKKALYAHIGAQHEGGRVPTAALAAALQEILSASDETKNS